VANIPETVTASGLCITANVDQVLPEQFEFDVDRRLQLSSVSVTHPLLLQDSQEMPKSRPDRVDMAHTRPRASAIRQMNIHELRYENVIEIRKS
jgi:hypothetical protein